MLTLVGEPAVELFALDEIKEQMRIESDQTEDDAYLMRLQRAVRMHLDGYSGWLGRCLITQSWRLDLECFRHIIRIPLTPLQSVTSITYKDSNGDTQTVATSVYEVIANKWEGKVRRLTSQSWPTDVSTEYLYPISITFKAGWGDSWNDVPEDIRVGMLMMMTELYEARGEHMPSNYMENSRAKQLLAQYRFVGFA